MGFFDFLKPLFGSETGVLTKAVVKPVVQATGGFNENGKITGASLINGVLKTPSALATVAEKGVEVAANFAEKVPVFKAEAEGLRDFAKSIKEGVDIASGVAEDVKKADIKSIGDLSKLEDIGKKALEKAETVAPKGAMFAPKGIPVAPPMPVAVPPPPKRQAPAPKDIVDSIDPRRVVKVESPISPQVVEPIIPRNPATKRPEIDPRPDDLKRRR